MKSIDCHLCAFADVDGNCTLDITTTSFEEGCCDFEEDTEDDGE